MWGLPEENNKVFLPQTQLHPPLHSFPFHTTPGAMD